MAKRRPLEGKKALVTSGPTHEPIDPVRFLSNRSSGRQGHAVAEALRDLGADVTLVAGPVALPDPPGMRVYHILAAREMMAACERALPVDIAVCAAAVSDWRVKRPANRKIKKLSGKTPVLALLENPDILKTLARRRRHRPPLVVGFAAETENLMKNATAKLRCKGCDWIVANDVSGGQAFEAADNQVTLITREEAQPWPRLSKREVAARLAERIAEHFAHAADGSLC